MAEQRPTPLHAPAPSSGDVAANYRYWQEHGGEWVEEYAQRKQRNILYHIQELMLVDYLLHHTPSKVLEFGCGVGRHLRNLSQISGLDVFGYDQSPTMVQGCLRWTGQTWIDTHIALAGPLGPLPYADGTFDVVYTAEVLVHVRPEDLPTILAELIRVCRGHILHLETAEHYELVSHEHSGCWKHDLVAAYAHLGRQCELLPAGYVAHSPYRVVVGVAPRYTWPPLLLGMFRQMETDINRGFGELRQGIEQYAGTLAQWRQRAATLETDARQQTEARTAAEQRCAELTREIADLRAALGRQVETLRGYMTDEARERQQQAEYLEHLQHDRELFLAHADRLQKG